MDGVIERFLKSIQPNITEDQVSAVKGVLEVFWLYEDPMEPPSSGAFFCAAQSNDLASASTAFFACAGPRHLPFEATIAAFKKAANQPHTFCYLMDEEPHYGFGHPIYKDVDPRVEEYFSKYPPIGTWTREAKEMIGLTPVLNPAGLFAAVCMDCDLDERAAVLPMISRLLGLSTLYKPSKKLKSTYESISNPVYPRESIENLFE